MTNEDPIVPAHGTIPDTSLDIQELIANNNASNATVSPSWDLTRRIIINDLGVDPDQVVPHARFVPDETKPNTPHLGADSLDLVELTMRFEEEFNIEISDEQAEGITTVASAVELIDYIKARA